MMSVMTNRRATSSTELRLFRDWVVSWHTGQAVTYGPTPVFFPDAPPQTERGCVEWPFGVSHWGYGMHNDVDFDSPIVTRQVLELVVGSAPESNERMMALHSCDNPPCINPVHLRWGTDLENMQDQILRGRRRNGAGTANGRARLTEENVHEVDSLLAAGVSQAEIASQFGIAQTTVAAIRRRAIWSHVEPRVELPKGLARRPKMLR